MEKAFDSVWHAGLIYKLFAIFNLPLYIVSLIHSYIQNRTFQVRIEERYSLPKHLCAGVPQGTVLSPQLYTLYQWRLVVNLKGSAQNEGQIAPKIF